MAVAGERQIRFCNIWPDLLWAVEARELDDEDIGTIFRSLSHLQTASVLDLVACARHRERDTYRFPNQGTPFVLFQLANIAEGNVDVLVIAVVLLEGESEIDDENSGSSTASSPR